MRTGHHLHIIHGYDLEMNVLLAEMGKSMIGKSSSTMKRRQLTMSNFGELNSISGRKLRGNTWILLTGKHEPIVVDKKTYN